MKKETRHTVEIIDPEYMEDYINDAIEGHEEDFEVHFTYLYSIGWSDSDNKDNDEGVYKIEAHLYKETGYNVNCGHPQSFDPSELVVYKNQVILVTAGPNMFASLKTFQTLAKDAGVDLKPYKVKE